MQEVYGLLSNSTRCTSSSIDAVVEFVDALFYYVNHLLSSQAHFSIVPLKQEIKDLEKSLRFLGDLLHFTKRFSNEAEKLKDLLIQAESVADNIAFLLCLCSDDNTEIKLQLSYQLQKINPNRLYVREIYIKVLKALPRKGQITVLVDEHVMGFLDSLLGNMKELSDLKVCSLISVIDMLEPLHKEMKIWRYYLLDPSAQKYTKNHPKVNSLLLHINFILCEAACVIYSCYDYDANEDMVRQLNLAISDLLRKFKIIRQVARNIYGGIIAKSLRSNFPKTNERGYMEFLIQNQQEILNSKADSITQLQHQIETVQRSTLSLRDDFIQMTEQPREDEQLKDPWTHFKDVVYQTEFVIDSFILKDKPLWFYMLGLLDVLEQINLIRREVNDIRDKRMKDSAGVTIFQNLGSVSSQAKWGELDALPDANYELANEAKNHIGYLNLFEDEAKEITEQLTNGLTQLHILSIVGMPGIGKTTFANSIYANPSFHLLFHVRARCCVTQVYNKRRLLLQILQEAGGLNDQGNDMNADDLSEKLYQILKGKKYLIFFDDLWDIRPWMEIRASFPDDNNGSRIMFTSRFHNITSKIESKSLTYPLNLISDSKSWDLLQVNLFQKESCPKELSEVGQRIAENCKGLAIAVDLVAGILRTKDRTKDCWEQVANSLNTQLLEDQQGKCMGILELSYKNLANHLKPCFLYFGAFPEDHEVPTSKLIWLWIAEGFVQLQKDDKGSLEDVAESYLNDLISRSLVIDSKRGTFGRVKASRVHDLLHDFALIKAKEECFMQHISRVSENFALSSEANAVYEPYKYRVCIYDGWDDLVPILDPCFLHARSLVLYQSVSSYIPYDEFSFVTKNFKLLRVLHLWDISSPYCLDIFSLVHLRFLSLKTWMEMVPEDIGKLQSLETFLVRTNAYTEVDLPSAIWNLVRLRHMKIITDKYWCSMPQYPMEEPFKFDTLQTLSTPCLCYGEDTEKIMRGLPNLRKLSCIFKGSWDNSAKCNRFPVLDFLTRLESLKVSYVGDVLLACEFNFPSNLKKLSLSKFRLPWSEISTIGEHPNLKVLKLLNDAFVGKTWHMTEGKFLKLKYLKLRSLDLAKWNLDEDNLPCLETLVLEICNKIAEIPPCLGDMPTLRRLELRGCMHSASYLAKIIREKQEDLGNEQFVVTIG